MEGTPSPRRSIVTPPPGAPRRPGDDREPRSLSAAEAFRPDGTDPAASGSWRERLRHAFDLQTNPIEAGPRPDLPQWTQWRLDESGTAGRYCRACSFDLRGAVGETCPECGMPFSSSDQASYRPRPQPTVRPLHGFAIGVAIASFLVVLPALANMPGGFSFSGSPAVLAQALLVSSPVLVVGGAVGTLVARLQSVVHPRSNDD